jgi:hypothetical protein
MPEITLICGEELHDMLRGVKTVAASPDRRPEPRRRAVARADTRPIEEEDTPWTRSPQGQEHPDHRRRPGHGRAATPIHFAEQGANVCLGDVNEDGGPGGRRADQRAGNGQAMAVKMDVTKREDNAAAVAATVEAFGSINVGLLNAGVNKPKMFMDIDEDNWDLIMNINAKGVLLGMQEAARQMISAGSDGGSPLQAYQCRLDLSRKPPSRT